MGIYAFFAAVKNTKKTSRINVVILFVAIITRRLFIIARGCV